MFKTKQRFNKWANNYDKSILQKFLFDITHRKIIKYLKLYIKDNFKILDIGCGTGELIIKLHNAFKYYLTFYGLDKSDKMIKKASLKKWTVQWDIGESEDLPYANDKFDIVISSHAFHHFPYKKKALREMYRVLKPKGIVIIADMFPKGLWGRILTFFLKLYEGNIFHSSKSQLESLFQEANFNVVLQSSFNWLIPTLITIGEKNEIS